ncbi:MAG: patatin family protein [Ruminococcaceae bacterium]|nr:patatin family protein [Oscillospiraceae bacterium]
MLGIVDVGGGLRAVYGAGILDYCLDQRICFDWYGGVSAGAGNLISFLSGQWGRNHRFYTRYSSRPEYMGLRTLLRTGAYLNLDYIYSEIAHSQGEDPLDFDAFTAKGLPLVIVATDGNTGAPYYFTGADLQKDAYDPLIASSTLPVVCKPRQIGGIPYFDGGLSDPIPLQKALDAGCERVVVILSRPRDYFRTGEKDARFAALLRRSYPEVARLLRERFRLYNDQLSYAHALETEGRALILAPEDCCGVNTLTRDASRLNRLYQSGYADATRLSRWLEG